MASLQTIELNKGIIIKKLDELKKGYDERDLTQLELWLHRLINDSNDLKRKTKDQKLINKLEKILQWAEPMFQKIKLTLDQLHNKAA